MKIWIIVMDHRETIEICEVYTDEETFKLRWDQLRREEMELSDDQELDQAAWTEFWSCKMYGTLEYFIQEVNCD